MTQFWQDRSVFVTGGTGLMGAAIVEDLLKLGAHVVCLVRDWVPQARLLSSELANQISVVRGDVEDQAVLERTIGEYEASVVFHLAAQTIVGIANRNPISTFESNIAGTWRLLEAVRRSPAVQSVVLASSDKAYGEVENLPYKEETPLQGRHPYDVSKSCADLLAQSYAHTYGVPVAITRCGNLYGAGDLNWNRIIPGTILAALRGIQPVIRSDGSPIRDYFYAGDASHAYIALAQMLAMDDRWRGEAFNFSVEQPMSVTNIVSEILRLMDSDLEPEIQGDASNEIQAQYLDASKAREQLGWQPQFGLEDGLKTTIQWYRDNVVIV